MKTSSLSAVAIVLLVLLLALSTNGDDSSSSSSSHVEEEKSNSHECMAKDDETCSAAAEGVVKKDTTTVLVTGANGFLGSWIVKELLEGEYRVHACVRTVEKAQHLWQLDGSRDRLQIFTTGNLGDDPMAFDNAIRGVEAVMHVSMAMDWNNPEHGMYHGTLRGTQHLLESIERHGVPVMVLTSSTSAVPVQPHGILTIEDHWTDIEAEKAHGNWYAATKTAQERLVLDWTATTHPTTRVVTICPHRILGPPLVDTPYVDGWMSVLQSWLQGNGLEEGLPNDTMEFVHVQDVARLHIAAMEQPQASGRYLAVEDSWHWNEFAEKLHQLHLGMPDTQPYVGDDDKVPPKQYSKQRRNDELGFAMRGMDSILEESVDYLQSNDFLVY